MEIISEEQRINDELVRFRDQAKALRISNESLIEKLDRIEDNLYDEARSIRRETLLKHPQKQQQKGLSGGSGHVITDDGLDVTTSETYIESLQLKYSNNNNAEDDDNDNNDHDDDDDDEAVKEDKRNYNANAPVPIVGLVQLSLIHISEPTRRS